MKDKGGNVVPPELEQVFGEGVTALKSMQKSLRSVARQAAKLYRHPAAAYTNPAIINQQCSLLVQIIDAGMPTGVCDQEHADGVMCERCLGAGYLPKCAYLKHIWKPSEAQVRVAQRSGVSHAAVMPGRVLSKNIEAAAQAQMWGMDTLTVYALFAGLSNMPGECEVMLMAENWKTGDVEVSACRGVDIEPLAYDMHKTYVVLWGGGPVRYRLGTPKSLAAGPQAICSASLESARNAVYVKSVEDIFGPLMDDNPTEE